LSAAFCIQLDKYRQCFGSLPENLISIKTSANKVLTAFCGTCVSKRLSRLYTLKSKFWYQLNNVSLKCCYMHFAFKPWRRYFRTVQRNRTSEILLKHGTKFYNEFSNVDLHQLRRIFCPLSVVCLKWYV